MQLFLETKYCRTGGFKVQNVTFTFKVFVVFILNLKYCKIIYNEITGGCASKVNTAVLWLRITDDHAPYCHFHKIVLNKKAELECETSQFFSEIKQRVISLRHKTCLTQVCECKSS